MEKTNFEKWNETGTLPDNDAALAMLMFRAYRMSADNKDHQSRIAHAFPEWFISKRIDSQVAIDSIEKVEKLKSMLFEEIPSNVRAVSGMVVVITDDEKSVAYASVIGSVDAFDLMRLSDMFKDSCGNMVMQSLQKMRGGAI